MGISLSRPIFENEDSGECTSPPITRILPKKLDPRSPTEGIARTPIEISCTPKSKDAKRLETTSKFDTPKSTRFENTACEIIKKLNIDCDEQGTEVQQNGEDSVKQNEHPYLNYNDTNCDKDDGCDFNKSDESVELVNADEKTTQVQNEPGPPPKRTTYLETDIDAVDDSFLNTLYIEHPRVKQLKSNKNSSKTNTSTAPNDYSINTSMEVKHSETSMRINDSMSFSDMASFDDLSLMVSDFDEASLVAHHTSVCKPTAVQDWLITIEDNCDNLMPFDVSSTDDNSDVRSQQSEVSDYKLNSFVASAQDLSLNLDGQKNQPLNERTPLGCLVQNKLNEPIKDGSSLKKKQWRGIQEERQRRGLSLGDENTPPLPPPADKVWSAPGKLTRRRNITEWDQDSTTILI